MPSYRIITNPKTIDFADKHKNQIVHTEKYFDETEHGLKFLGHEPYWNFGLIEAPMTEAFAAAESKNYVVPPEAKKITITNASERLLMVHNNDSPVGFPVIAGSMTSIEDIDGRIQTLRIVNKGGIIVADRVIVCSYL